MLKLNKQKVNNIECRENVQAYYMYLMIIGAPLLEAVKRAHYEIFDAFSNFSNTPDNQIGRRVY